MKRFKTAEYINKDYPKSDKYSRTEVLTAEDGAVDLGGIFGILQPGGHVPYHIHIARESVFIALYGEAIQIVEGKDHPIKAGDIMFIPSGEKHGLVNKSNTPFRYLEFWTHPPALADFVETSLS